MTKFGSWLNKHEVTRPAAAAALGISRQYVCMLSSGSASPGPKLAHAIERWTREVSPLGVVRHIDWPARAADEPTAFAVYLRKNKISRAKAAKALRWTPQRTYLLAAGTRRPTDAEAAKIEEWTGREVAQGSW